MSTDVWLGLVLAAVALQFFASLFWSWRVSRGLDLASRKLKGLTKATDKANDLLVDRMEALEANDPTHKSRVISDRIQDAVINRSLWPQVEGLITLYRILDGKQSLPSTRRWALSPDMLLHLARHIEESAPRTIIECGAGSSTIAMAAMLRAFGQEGHIYSIESDPRFVKEVGAQLKRRGLERYATLIDAPLVTRHYRGHERQFSWYDFDRALLPDGADMLVVDGPPGATNSLARYPAGPELIPTLAAGAGIFVDDVKRPDEQLMLKLWREMFPGLGEVRDLYAENGGVLVVKER